MVNTNDSFQGKHDYIAKLMAGAANANGKVEPRVRNSLIADGETGWEMGLFDDQEHRSPFDAERDGFIIRARRDALTATLNSGDALDMLTEMESRLARIDKKLAQTQAWVLVCLFMLAVVLVKVI